MICTSVKTCGGTTFFHDEPLSHWMSVQLPVTFPCSYTAPPSSDIAVVEKSGENGPAPVLHPQPPLLHETVQAPGEGGDAQLKWYKSLSGWGKYPLQSPGMVAAQFCGTACDWLE